MTKKEMYEIAEKAEKLLRDDDIFVDVYPFYLDIPVISVEIRWGDWKHSHLRAKYLLEKQGYTLIQTIVTEEDGSDCYSAIHHFLVKGENE